MGLVIGGVGVGVTKNTEIEPFGLRGGQATRGNRSTRVAGQRGVRFIDSDGNDVLAPEWVIQGAVVSGDDDDGGVITIGGTGGSPPAGGGDNDITHYSAVTVVASAGSTETLNMGAGKFFYLILDANLTITLTNPPESGQLHQYLIALVQGGTGSYTVTWPANVYWADTDGTPTTTDPALYTAVGAQNDVLLSTIDGGGTWGATMLGTGGGASALDDLSDVTLTSPALDDDLRFNGSVWVNDDRKWEVVTGGEDVLVWDGDNLVYDWSV